MTTRIAAIAMHSTMGEPDLNLERIAGWMRKANAEGASFVVFNEEGITGSMNKSDLSFSEAMTIAEHASEKAVPFLESLCRELEMTAVVGTIEPAGDRFLNSALIVGPDGYLTTFSKLHLPNKIEREWFEPGPSLPVVTSQGWTFGVGICFDVRFPEIFRTAAQHGAELFFVAVGGSGVADQVTAGGDRSRQARVQIEQTMKLLPARAIDNGLYVIFANQAGQSGNASFPGFCLAVAPDGSLVGEHATGNEGMIVVEVSKQAVEDAKMSGSCTVKAVRPDVYSAPIIVDSPTRQAVRAGL